MENSFAALIENSKQAVRYWWLLLLTGIALLVIGIVVFAFPAQSYIGMSLMFGWLILLSGIFQVILSTANKHYITGRGWMLAGGIIEIVLGAILVWNVALSAGILLLLCSLWVLIQPLVFGTTMVVVWVGISLLFAGIAAISLAMQLKSAHKHLQKLA